MQGMSHSPYIPANIYSVVHTVKLGNKELFGHPKIVHCPYEVNWQLVTEMVP